MLRRTPVKNARKPRRPGRPKADVADLRERVLDAAMACFAKHGIGATPLRAIAQAAPDLPLIIYNIQGRTAVNMETDTLARLAQIPNIVGVKEASGSLDQMTAVILACGPEFTVLSGDDNLTLPLMSVGGRGVISVVGNFLAREVADVTHAALEGDWKRARDLHLKLYPVCKAMFIETNPIPVKEAMAMLGMIRAEWRLPMCPMTPANREKLRQALLQAGVLKA
jgi:4-hydroxy-tetrahydrodipicolinate synthase